jgi:peptidoglycan/xylan/chitin deacetylase (PgdA/CDA1 family)
MEKYWLPYHLFILIRRSIYLVLGFIDRLLKRSTSLSVYCYHSVSDDWRYGVPTTLLEKQMMYLTSHSQFISLSNLEKYLSGKLVINSPVFFVTFDDGYADIVSAIPIMKKFKIEPTVFVLTGKNVNRKSLRTERPLLSQPQIKDLVRESWTIGSHGANHQDLCNLSDKELSNEIKSPQNLLTKITGKQIKYFAFPKGKYSNHVIEELKKCGYKLAFSMDDRVINNLSSKYNLPRIGVDGSHSFAEFKVLASPSVIAFRNLIKHTPIAKYI